MKKILILIAALIVTPAQAETFVYVSNADSRDIYVLKLDAGNGDLVLVQTIAVTGQVMPMAVSPDKQFLYAALRSQPFAAASFAIDQKSGMLTHIANGPLADSMPYIATDRTGRYLLSASYGGNKFTVNPIGPNGVIGAPLQVLNTDTMAHSIMTDRSNRYALAATLGSDTLHQLKFDPVHGTLTPNSPAGVKVREKAGPRHFRFHPNNRFVFLLNELDASIYTFNYDERSGSMTSQSIASALPKGFKDKPWAADIHLTPDGKYLYASERTSSTISGYRVDPATGALALLGTWPTEKTPRGFAIDPTGRYLLAVGQGSHRMTVYAIHYDSGNLWKLADYPMGNNPNWVEIVALP